MAKTLGLTRRTDTSGTPAVTEESNLRAGARKRVSIRVPPPPLASETGFPTLHGVVEPPLPIGPGREWVSPVPVGRLVKTEGVGLIDWNG